MIHVFIQDGAPMFNGTFGTLNIPVGKFYQFDWKNALGVFIKANNKNYTISYTFATLTNTCAF